MVREKGLQALFVVSMVLGLTIAVPEVHAEPFDKPLQKKVVDLGRSKLLMPYDNRHVTLTCSYYPDFMIKQLDDPGNKGALYIELVSAQAGATAKCIRKHESVAQSFGRNCAYFSGVKRDLVWIDDCDGTNGGLGFAVFDSKTMARVFRDSESLLDHRGKQRFEFDFIRSSKEQIAFKYLRVVTGNCSVPKDGNACWGKLKKQLGLTSSSMPHCSDEEGQYAGTSPSVITYPVEVTLYPKPSIKPLGNPVRCGTVD